MLEWLLKSDGGWVGCPQCDTTRLTVTSESQISVIGDGWSIDSRPLAACRSEVRTHLLQHLRGILAALGNAISDNAAAERARLNWTRLSAEAVAAHLLRTTVDPANHLPAPSQARLDRCQASALLELPSALIEGGRRIDQILPRYITAGLVAADAAAQLSRTEPLTGEDAPAPDRWALSAVIAAASPAAGQADPHAMRTAEAYVGLRWAELTGRIPDRPSLRPEPSSCANSCPRPHSLMSLFACMPTLPYGPTVDRILDNLSKPDLVSRVHHEAALRSEQAHQSFLTDIDRAHGRPINDHARPKPPRHDALVRDQGREDDLVRAGRHAFTLGDGSGQVQAALLTALGPALNGARRPAEFLALAGTHPADWESELPPARGSPWPLNAQLRSG